MGVNDTQPGKTAMRFRTICAAVLGGLALILAPILALTPPAQAGGAMDGTTQLAVPAEPGTGTAPPGPAAAQATSIWVDCADEGQDCEPGTDDLVVMRYGTGENFTYVIVQGVAKVKCSNTWGDPSHGDDKACAFIRKNVFAVPDAADFNTVADEGETFTIDGPGPVWVRFGLDGRWIYTLAAGFQIETVPCSNDFFRMDPLHGANKICQIGGAYTLGQGDLIECAVENQDCRPDVAGPVLLKYGAEDGYDYRFVHQKDNTIPCTNAYAGKDPRRGPHKRCYFQAVAPTGVETEGSWREVISCAGAGCSISHAIEVGTERSNSWTTTEEWSQTVTTSMEAGFEIEGVGAKVSTSVSDSYAQSSAFTKALSITETQTYTAECASDPKYDSRALYQFGTVTREDCLENGDCDGATFTAQYVCVGNAPPGYAGPACVPGYCADALCTTCDYPG